MQKVDIHLLHSFLECHKKECMEIWKSIKDYEGCYEVSNYGRIKSLERVVYKIDGKTQLVKERILKQKISKGYFQVILSKNKIRITEYVHIIVAETFCNHIRNGRSQHVNHINFIKKDNRIENLESVTARENLNRKHLKSSTIYTGVCEAKGKYRARIVVSKKIVHLGYFKDALEASNAYQKALAELINH